MGNFWGNPELGEVQWFHSFFLSSRQCSTTVSGSWNIDSGYKRDIPPLIVRYHRYKLARASLWLIITEYSSKWLSQDVEHSRPSLYGSLVSIHFFVACEKVLLWQTLPKLRRGRRKCWKMYRQAHSSWLWLCRKSFPSWFVLRILTFHSSLSETCILCKPFLSHRCQSR